MIHNVKIFHSDQVFWHFLAFIFVENSKSKKFFTQQVKSNLRNFIDKKGTFYEHLNEYTSANDYYYNWIDIVWGRWVFVFWDFFSYQIKFDIQVKWDLIPQRPNKKDNRIQGYFLDEAVIFSTSNFFSLFKLDHWV